MGINKEVRKLFGSSVTNYIIAARTAQGYEEWQSSILEERMDIVKRWKERKSELQSEKQKVVEEGPDGQEQGHLSRKGFLQRKYFSNEEWKKLSEERKEIRDLERRKTYGGPGGSHCPYCILTHAHNHRHSTSDLHERHSISEDTHGIDFEEAIHASVAATSRGDSEEDLLIERAIRASVRELQSHGSSTISEQEAIDRAIKASIAEARRGASESPSDAEHTAALEKALQKSLNDSKVASHISNTSDLDANEEKLMKMAIEESKATHAQYTDKAKTEEEIVLEYVKKQSLAEEGHKKALQSKRDAVLISTQEDDDLRQAIEESLKGR